MINDSQARGSVESLPIQKAKVGDIEIKYKVLENQSTSGDGKDNDPILFIAGLRVTMDMWPPILLSELAQSSRRVIIYNNRGTGNSTDGTKDYTISHLANDTAGLLDALVIDKAHIIGWSMGSYIT